MAQYTIPPYAPTALEKAVQEKWRLQKPFKATESTRGEKFYCLSMFAYPSGNLHMGHVRNYTIGDVIARYQRMKGKNVLHPMGWDAFGLPAENAALAHGSLPAVWTDHNIAHMRTQLMAFGFSFDWDRELRTDDPAYYRWEQWFFTQLHATGMAYKATKAVNWCPQDQTVLANEQVVDGKCWRCDTPVQQKPLSQWFLRITQYAEELLAGLETLSEWPEQVKQMQRHWIGKAEGLEVRFALKNSPESLSIFTARPETLPGVTYLAIAPEHALTKKAAEVSKSVSGFLAKLARSAVQARKKPTLSGIATPFVAAHPISQAPLSIWISTDVSMQEDEGAVMAVPAHDTRDHAFARQHELPIRPVIHPTADRPDESFCREQPYLGEGYLHDSGASTGQPSTEARAQILADLVQTKVGIPRTRYRLQDWSLSRQRYWGAPIPMATGPDGTIYAVPSDQLPVRLPPPTAFQGQKAEPSDPSLWKNVTIHGIECLRETDTFDTFLESSWYYARFACPDHHTSMLDPEKTRYWLPVDHYIGGIEHATMHLIYFRFFHKLLRDAGWIETDEPVKRLTCQGMVLAHAFYREEDNGTLTWLEPNQLTICQNTNGEFTAVTDAAGRTVRHAGMYKMSKSKKNGVDPAPFLESVGADTIRLFMMFAAPPEAALEWSPAGVEGAHRFLKRLWAFTFQQISASEAEPAQAALSEAQPGERQLRYDLHKLIAKVSREMESRLAFNTAVAAIMEFFNGLVKAAQSLAVSRRFVEDALKVVLQLLHPIVPHITHTLWHALGEEAAIEASRWPTADPAWLGQENGILVVQANGKKIATMNGVSKLSSEATVLVQAKALPEVRKLLARQQLISWIYRPGQILNLVVKPQASTDSPSPEA